jgi:hypothetical protein
MRKAILTVLAVSSLVLVGCATIQVSEDFDRRAPFTTYKTFDWMPAPAKMPENARAAIDRNPLLGKRIQDITDEILADKGLTLAKESPDILINYYVGFRERIDITGWGYWYGPRWGYYWPYLGPYDDYTYTQGTLVLDFVDAKTHELVWRGIADKALYDYYYAGPANRNFSDRELWRILTKILALYPPSRHGNRLRY